MQRHTTDLQQIAHFYTTIAGLEQTGGFRDHEGYTGIFLSLPGQDWELEFTASADQPVHRFDEEDILVLYVNTALELDSIKKRIEAHNIAIETPKNPYWQQYGLQVSDPEGYKVIFAIRHLELSASDPLTSLVKEKDIRTWSDLVTYIRALPYGRNTNREDLSLVLKEGKGTCSSKHSFLRKIALLHHIPQVQLILGMYRMDHLNTPKIQSTITDSGLEYIPEAHCYLKINNRRIDLTTANTDMERLAKDIIEETEITPEQVNTFKGAYHKDYLRQWIAENDIPMDFDTLWAIREKCIEKLSAS